MENADFWIERLNLSKHPEGGYYREVYRSDETIDEKALPARYAGSRAFATSIYFLLKKNGVSTFHRIRSDETWHFYRGSALELFILDRRDGLIRHLLGPDPGAGEVLQVTIPHDHWFGARVADQKNFALLGCTVAPGFDYRDFETAAREKLLDEYPEHESLIKALCP